MAGLDGAQLVSMATSQAALNISWAPKLMAYIRPEIEKAWRY